MLGQVAWYNQRSMVFRTFTSNSPTALNVPQNQPEKTRRGRGHTDIMNSNIITKIPEKNREKTRNYSYCEEIVNF